MASPSPIDSTRPSVLSGITRQEATTPPKTPKVDALSPPAELAINLINAYNDHTTSGDQNALNFLKKQYSENPDLFIEALKEIRKTKAEKPATSPKATEAKLEEADDEEVAAVTPPVDYKKMADEITKLLNIFSLSGKQVDNLSSLMKFNKENKAAKKADQWIEVKETQNTSLEPDFIKGELARANRELGYSKWTTSGPGICENLAMAVVAPFAGIIRVAEAVVKIATNIILSLGYIIGAYCLCAADEKKAARLLNAEHKALYLKHDAVNFLSGLVAMIPVIGLGLLTHFADQRYNYPAEETLDNRRMINPSHDSRSENRYNFALRGQPQVLTSL